MSLVKLFQRFNRIFQNSDLDKSRKKHDDLPKTEYGKGEVISQKEIEADKATSFTKSKALGQVLLANIQEHYSLSEREKVMDSLLKALQYLLGNARLFPDMDHAEIWYTDYYDLIEISKDMGFGDDTLPHWPEEPNIHKRYLEITTSDLVQIFLKFFDKALLNDYEFQSTEEWIIYLFRETLKSKKRRIRQQQKYNDGSIFFSESANQQNQQL